MAEQTPELLRQGWRLLTSLSKKWFVRPVILTVSAGPSGIVSHGRVRAWRKQFLGLGSSLTGSVQEVEGTCREERFGVSEINATSQSRKGSVSCTDYGKGARQRRFPPGIRAIVELRSGRRNRQGLLYERQFVEEEASRRVKAGVAWVKGQ